MNHKEYSARYYASNREKIKAAVRDYREKHPDRVFEARLKTCNRNPTKKNAQKTVYEAIRAGVLANPQVCSKCGATGSKRRIEAHHEDYTKPLDVEWLCTLCHREADAARRASEGLEPYGNYSHHDKRKLTRAQVLEIRAGGTLASHAERLGVSIGTIQKVRDGKTYKDVR